MRNEFHTQAESGISLVGVLVGLVIGGLVVTKSFAFMQNMQLRAHELKAAAQATEHYALFLRQALSERCSEFLNEDLKFQPMSDNSKRSVLQLSRSQIDGFRGGKSPLRAMADKSGTAYNLQSMTVVQKSGLIGMRPSMVYIELELKVDRVAGNVKNTPTHTYVVPMMLELNDDLTAKSCMGLPLASDICKRDGGAFDEGKHVCKL